MSRPKKAGLDFYYKDVDETDDYRRMLLMDKFGPKGWTVMDYITGRVYKNGYYLEIPVNYLAAQIKRSIGDKWIDMDTVIEIIDFCAEIGLLDKRLLAQSVITSEELQRNYSYVSARRKADRSKYWLLPDENDNSDEISSETETASSAAYIPDVKQNQTVNGINSTEIPKAQNCQSDNGINATVIPPKEDIKSDNGINAAVITQSREDNSREDNSKAEQKKEYELKAEQSKAEQKKEYELKAEHSKAEQSSTFKSARKSADEIFLSDDCADDYCRSHAAATDGGEDLPAADDDDYSWVITPPGWSFNDQLPIVDMTSVAAASPAAANADNVNAHAAAAAADYEKIDKAFFAAVGTHLSPADRENIDALFREGADNYMIIYALNKVASRHDQKKIFSFSYFIPMIREMIGELNSSLSNGKKKKLPADYGFIHNDM